MTSETLNIGKLMREEAAQAQGKRNIALRVSKEAIQEQISFIKARLEAQVNLAGEATLRNKRKTITSEDIIEANGIKIPVKEVDHGST